MIERRPFGVELLWCDNGSSATDLAGRPQPPRNPGNCRMMRYSLLLALPVWLTGNAASGQTSPDAAYDRMIEAICRGYASAVKPPDVAFASCMKERGCVPLGSSTYRCEPPGPPQMKQRD